MSPNFPRTANIMPITLSQNPMKNQEKVLIASSLLSRSGNSFPISCRCPSVYNDQLIAISVPITLHLSAWQNATNRITAVVNSAQTEPRY